jgi:hypothetical protein
MGPAGPTDHQIAHNPAPDPITPCVWWPNAPILCCTAAEEVWLLLLSTRLPNDPWS